MQYCISCGNRNIYILCVPVLHSVTIVSYILCDNYVKYLLAIMNYTYSVKIMQYSLYLFFTSYPGLSHCTTSRAWQSCTSPVSCLFTSYSNHNLSCKSCTKSWENHALCILASTWFILQITPHILRQSCTISWVNRGLFPKAIMHYIWGNHVPYILR